MLKSKVTGNVDEWINWGPTRNARCLLQIYMQIALLVDCLGGGGMEDLSEGGLANE